MHDTKEENWSARIKAHTRTLDTYGTIKQPSFQVKAEQDSNTVSWKKVSHAAGYNIYRRPGKGGKWSKIASVSGSVLKYKDTKITQPSLTGTQSVPGIRQEGKLI